MSLISPLGIGSTLREGAKSLVNILDLPLGMVNAAHAGAVAAQSGDVIGASQSFLEFSRGALSAPNYTFTGLQKALQIGQFLPESLAKYLPTGLDPNFIHFIQGSTVTGLLVGFGAVISSFGIIIESLGLYRQEQVWDCIKDIPKDMNDDALTDALTKLQELNFNNFFRSLPEYIKKEITDHAKANTAFEKLEPEYILGYLQHEIKNGRNVFAKHLIGEIRTAAVRQQVAHLVGIAASAFGLAASMALCIGCPLVALTLLSLVATGLVVISIAMKKGWVENPKDGFSLRVCLPEFLRGEKEEIEMELATFETSEIEEMPKEELSFFDKIYAWFKLSSEPGMDA